MFDRKENLRLKIHDLLGAIGSLSKQELREMGYNWDEATTILDVKLQFQKNDFVSGRVRNRNNK